MRRDKFGSPKRSPFTLHVYLGEETYLELEKIAKEKERSMSWMIRKACELALKHMNSEVKGL